MIIWNLDTENDGCDETELKGTADQVRQDVMNFHGLVEWPNHWTLRQVYNTDGYACRLGW